jgi:hypothetical protein
VSEAVFSTQRRKGRKDFLMKKSHDAKGPLYQMKEAGIQ